MIFLVLLHFVTEFAEDINDGAAELNRLNFILDDGVLRNVKLER